MEVLDREPGDWAGLVALNAFADTALSVQFEALAECCYLPLRQRTGKLLLEERYHAAHAGAWARRFLHADAGARERFTALAGAMLPPLLAWFGIQSGRGGLLADAGVCDAGPDALRARFRARIAPLLQLMGAPGAELAADDVLSDFDEARRRRSAHDDGRTPPAGASLLLLEPAPEERFDGPDLETIVRVRGDRNRQFLLD